MIQQELILLLVKYIKYPIVVTVSVYFYLQSSGLAKEYLTLLCRKNKPSEIGGIVVR